MIVRQPASLRPFKHLATTIKERLPGVVLGMLDGRSNAYVEAMNGLLQQTKTAARGFRTVSNFIAIAYLRMAKLKHLPPNPLREDFNFLPLHPILDFTCFTVLHKRLILII